ncbi:MAG: CerR family C-terminal domain-containing protein [Hydrogenophaga sp.]|uniref:CerR family C-terminal domain-containing protein n=1 Tax=Hydrogenophaga sp. TaxID=1904254 RepID=UPI001DB7300C|nr:CerR family C-terminal domain-containing protein [Hydrogenophaga sp.]MBX3609611.1 CerR family C-terminal domain-containing protein [Hydrogenophaga sp.]
MPTARTPTAAPARGDATRELLIRAATDSFSLHGFDAVSTREITERAGVNQALIGYHFGGKEGLYLAVFDAIATQVQAQLAPVVGEVDALLNDPRPGGLTPAARRKRWLPPILSVADRMLGLMLSPQTEPWARLILREQAHPTAAFDRLYTGFMGELLQRLVALVMRLRDEPDETEARLLVVALVGQVVVWRASRASAQRLLGWPRIAQPESERARAALQRQLSALLLN